MHIVDALKVLVCFLAQMRQIPCKWSNKKSNLLVHQNHFCVCVSSVISK
jgi:hypothetical protein